MRMEPNSLSDEQKKNPRDIMDKADNQNSTYRTIIYPLVACNLLHE